MVVFNYKPKSNQSAQGKQKIYFCAHPDDYEIYFSKISDEILELLKKQDNKNCAFLYLEDPRAERDEDFFFKLKEMNLLIMPVTTKLLTTANPALDLEFAFAINNHIPVLPIMMESGLDAIFNKKCGNLQFLSPNAQDDTAISYEEKITKYLTSVLIDDKLVEKIKKAFDAYIFLSYRKKDRKFAQELMHLIHKNDFCRDIAIWYDEFLTPGENFNDAIADALKKSTLFALAVTPSILEKTVDTNGIEHDNYILQNEYPLATKKFKKPVLPAEFVETNKEELTIKFENIPPCIDAYNEQILSAYLEDIFHGIALLENDNDPEHSFFIGLAYLSGIDVEINSERALSLISFAANAGLFEAMEKLVSIYRSGEGVERDYEKALDWQAQIVENKKSVYLENKTETNAKKYIDMLVLFIHHTYELRKLDKTKSLCEELLSACDEIDSLFRSVWAMQKKAEGYRFLGDIHGSRDDRFGAEKYYLEAEKYYLKVLERISVTNGKDDTIYHDLFTNYIKIGDIKRNRNDLEGAKDYYFKALDKAKNTTTRNLSVSYNKIGYIYELRKDFKGAEKYYLLSLEIAQELANETKTYESIRNLSISCNSLGILYRTQGNLEKAKEYYLRSLNIREELANATQTIESFDSLAVSYYNMTFAMPEKKVEYLNKAISIWTRLAEQIPDIPEYSRRRDIATEVLNS